MAKLRKMLTHLGKNESGQGALAMVIILLMLGAIILTPLLVFMNTGLKAGQVYESKMQEFYAADAGVEDALWRIDNDELSSVIPNYDVYVYDTPYPPYQLPDEINDETVNVSIENVWIPWGVSGGAPSPADAGDIINGTLVVTGKVKDFSSGEYQIKISYDETNLNVDQVGVWLPSGFDYIPGGQGNLATYEPATVTSHCGGKAIVWDVDTDLASIPGGTFTFQFAGPANQDPQAVSWVTTAEPWMTTTGGTAVYLSWDADSKPYRIESTAGGTTAEAYVIKDELRKIGGTQEGDYCAVGATLMTATGGPISDSHYRDVLFRDSSATVQNSELENPGYIPPDAHVEYAWLYWSGWIEEAPGGPLLIWGPEDCSNFATPIMDWTAGSAWDADDERFKGTAYDKTSPGRYLTMSESIDLSAYAGQTVEVFWQQREDGSPESDDCLKYAFSSDDGGSWSEWNTSFCGDIWWGAQSFEVSIPQDYLTDGFRMRFNLEGFNERDRSWWSGRWVTEYCYVDNIGISVAQPLVEDAKVNRVLFNDIEITADPGDCQVAQTPDSGARDSWSYSCFKDVSNLELGAGAVVKALIEEKMSSSGSGSLSFTLGHVLEGDFYSLSPTGSTDYPLATPALSKADKYQWTYAGWSLIVIYSSPETKGHYLCVFDDFHYVGAGGQPTTLEFPISGFLAPDDTAGSHLTYFVGEGDDHYTGDSIKINGNPLRDPPDNPWDNIFNSYSNAIPGTTYKSGIDIDTFDMSEYIDSGDTSAEVILVTTRGAGGVAEIYNFVYIILSFRSDIHTGGTVSYLIK